MMFQFWKFVKCRFLAVKQDHMATTAPENVIIVKIVKHVISTQGHVMRMGVCCRVINHSCVMNVELDCMGPTVP